MSQASLPSWDICIASWVLIITRNLLPGHYLWQWAPLPGGFRKQTLSTDGHDPQRHRWTQSLEEMSKERAQLGHKKENKHLLLAMAVGKGVIRSIIRIWGRKLSNIPCPAGAFSALSVRKQRPMVICIPLIPPTKSPCGSFPPERY